MLGFFLSVFWINQLLGYDTLENFMELEPKCEKIKFLGINGDLGLECTNM